jgi:hypothetical protein
MSLASPARQQHPSGSASPLGVSDPSLTPKEFCAAEKISRSMLYKLWGQGKGPRWFYVGTTRRISHEARQEWRRAGEAAAAK